MDISLLIEKSTIVIILFLVTLGIAAYQTLMERKVAAWMQDRVGPDRAGPFGLLQPLADGGKMFFKEDFIPKNAERGLFILAPGLAMFTAAMTGAVIPWGPPIEMVGRTIALQVADINIGILYVIGFASIGVYGIMIGGWASNNKFSLFSAIRTSSQMISYELAMGIVIITIVLMSGSLSVATIVEQQHGFWADGYFTWNVFKQPLAFIIFLVTSLAECNRAPFDMAECENELIGGYHTEYSSMKLGFFLFAEYVNLFISAAIISALFFGGYNFPGMDHFSGITLSVLGTLVFFAKTIFFIFVFMWIRWTLPRFRYDQLMHLGWKKLIPLAMINMVITAVVIAFTSGWFSEEKKAATTVEVEQTQAAVVVNPVSNSKTESSFRISMNN